MGKLGYLLDNPEHRCRIAFVHLAPSACSAISAFVLQRKLTGRLVETRRGSHLWHPTHMVDILMMLISTQARKMKMAADQAVEPTRQVRYPLRIVRTRQTR